MEEKQCSGETLSQTSQNFLLSSPGHYKRSWKEHEIQALCSNITKILIGNVVISCACRLLVCLISDMNLGKLMFGCAGGALVFYVFTLLITEFRSYRARRLIAAIFLHLIQVYLLTVGLFLFPENLAMCILGSSLVFFNYELVSTQSTPIVIYLVLRQFLMWHLLGMYINHSAFNWNVPYLILATSVAHAIFLVSENRKRAIEKYSLCDSIEEQDLRIKSILQAIPEGLAVISLSGVLSCFNQCLCDLLQVSSITSAELEDKLTHFRCFELLKDKTLRIDPLLTEITQFLREAGMQFHTFGVTKLNGVYLEWKGSRCTWGDAEACILTVSDISSWVSLQALAQQESDSKSALLRFVSHELRTPTNAILNIVADVRDSVNLTPTQRTDLSMVISSTHFLLGVINDLLDFSKMVADKFRLVKSFFPLRQEVQTSVQLIELQCFHKDLSISVRFDSLIPEKVFSDPNRLKQVILNLLSNAVKFTFQGGIEVTCCMTERNTVRISVSDSGIGIPEDKIGNLFKSFGTIEGTERINPQGCGLGLFIANFITKSMGPKQIEVASVVGVGSCFSFEIDIFQYSIPHPVGVTDDTTDDSLTLQNTSLLPKSMIPSVRFRNVEALPSVLVVDDFDFNRVVMSKLLHSMHITCDEAETGVQALKLIRARNRRGHHYKMIFMDVEMPEMNGLEATEQVRTMVQTGELESMPNVIGCSAHSSKEDIDRCIQAGMGAYLEKPVSKNKLAEMLQFL